jgi:hypothetical protein
MISRHSTLACAALIAAAMFLVSCSQPASNPMLPATGDNDLQSRMEPAGHNKALWGTWEVIIDPVGGTIDAVPVRGAEFAANVTMFLQPPAGKLSNLKFENMDLTGFFGGGLIQIDVGLTHPFPGLNQYTGFDVMGVFRHEGSYVSNYDAAMSWGQPGVDGVLLNADGLTRWFNISEFTTPGILGYVPGSAGTPGFMPTATLCGFKFFADGLDKDQSLLDFFSIPGNCETRGCFKPGSTNYRHYVLQFPMDGDQPVLKFQYSVIANWESPESPPPPPEDFPIGANMGEGIVLSGSTTESSLYWHDATHFGGALKLKVEILDHQGAVNPAGITGEIGGIVVESPEPLVPGGYKLFNQGYLAGVAEAAGPASSIYTVEVIGCIPSSNADKPLLVTILSAEPTTYDSGIPGFVFPEGAKLAAHWVGSVSVSTVIPNDPPIGGDLSFHWDCAGDPCTSQPTTFEISQAYDPDGNPVTIKWDFDGDMDFSDDQDGSDSNLSAIYTYTVPGNHDVWCRIDDGTLHTDVGLLAINVLDCQPDTPTIVNTALDTTGLQARKIAYNPEGGYVYTCPHNSGSGVVSIVDVDPVDQAQVVNTVIVPGAWLATIDYANGYVYTSGGAGNGVVTIDVDPPETAHIVNTWNPGTGTGSMEDMHVIGNYLYVAAQWWGMIVLDISNPALPVERGHTGTAHAFTSSVMATPDNMWGFTTDGYHNSGYLSWINVVDLSNPDSPKIVKSLQIQNYDVLPTNSDLQGDYLYVVYHPWTGTGLLTIIDVSDPLNPVKVIDFPCGTGTWDVEAVGNFAYVSKGDLAVIDISNPSAPFMVGAVPTPPESRGSAIYCGTAYTGSNLVDIIDLY